MELPRLLIGFNLLDSDSTITNNIISQFNQLSNSSEILGPKYLNTEKINIRSHCDVHRVINWLPLPLYTYLCTYTHLLISEYQESRILVEGVKKTFETA